MAEVLFGAEALADLAESKKETGGEAEFTSFKSGTTMIVKPANISKEDSYISAVMSFYSYGVFKKVNSFVASSPSKKTQKGFPTDDLTPWDKAWKYYSDKSEKFGDDNSQEAYKYKPKKRFALAMIDLDSGEPVIVDLSDAQFVSVNDTFNKYIKRIDKMAFEITKSGKGTDTKVTATPIIEPEEDLTKEQFKHFEKVSNRVTPEMFAGLLYEQNEEQMIELLDQAGFDVTLVGLERPKKKSAEGQAPDMPEESLDDEPAGKANAEDDHGF